jgi:branched-chain amino acid transport system ATP-binding protein
VTSVLSVRNISKSFGGIQAVRGVSFEVAKGEILGLIGPNGSGKSTLFNCVLGQSTPDTGDVFVNERNVAGMRASHLNKLGVGRTFQQLSVFPEMTVAARCCRASSDHRMPV